MLSSEVQDWVILNPDQINQSSRMKATGRVQSTISSHQISTLFKSSAGKIPPAFWGLSDCLPADTAARICRWYADGNDSSDAFDLTNESLKEIVARVQLLTADAQGDSATIELAVAIEALAITHILAAAGKLAPQPDDSTFFELGRNELTQLSVAALRCDSIVELRTKSIGLEIGIILACFQSDVRTAVQMDWLEEFESIIDSNLDSDGWPDSRLLTQIGALSACWSRISSVLKSMELDLDGGIQIQLEWLVRQCLRMMQADGSLCFAAKGQSFVGEKSSDPMNDFDVAYWHSVASLSADPDDAVIFKMLMSRFDRKKQKRKKGHAKNGRKSGLSPLMANELVSPYNVSEWAGSFLLRGTWSPKSPRVAVDFSYRDSRVADGGQAAEQCFAQISRTIRLIHGQTLPEIIVDDQAVRLTGSFEVVCERHDDDVDYIEIQAELSCGGQLNRQWLLARTEEFLLVTDAVLPTSASKIEYRCRWPLANGVTTLEESETREVYLQSSSGTPEINALVLPIGLPEWKAEKFPGKLIAETDAIVLEQQVSGAALYAPLVFDLNPRRSLKKRTWRKLTVGQDRQIVADDQAMAFRFQLSKRQWFFYRALASMGNRTFLGENVNSEFVFNRLHKSGKVSSLFEVE